MNQSFLFLILSFILAGCMQAKALPHMNELLVLKAYSDEKEAQFKLVAGQQEIFERLIGAVKSGSIKSYTNQDAVAAEFGSPVVSDQVTQDGRAVTRWLYRHPIQKFATDRVYLYFGPDGQLIRSEHIPSKNLPS